MRKALLSIAGALFGLFLPTLLRGQAPSLGTAATFALFTGNGAFTNVGATVVTGDIGTNVGAFSGFPPGTVVGQTRLPGSPQANQAATDVTNAYAALASVTCGVIIGPTLGNGQVLTPGVYCQNTPAASSLIGTLVLDGPGLYIIKLSSAFSTASGSTVLLTNGACPNNVYFWVDGAVDIGVSSTFRGTILANGAIRLLAGATLEGRGLAVVGAITLSANTVTTSSPAACTTTAASSGTLSGTTYMDMNKNGVKDASDTPLPGVVVTLLNGSSSAVASTTSDATGGHSFTAITPGTSYSTSFSTPTGYSIVTPASGVSGPFSLSTGQKATGNDAGYTKSASPLTLGLVVDKSVVQPGDVLTYTLTVTNGSTSPITNVVVRDSLSPGLTYVPGSAVATAGTTIAAGTPISSWSIAAIGAGQTVTLTLQATATTSGILYNSATIPGDTARVCTSVPVKLCPGDEYTLSVPAGRSSYRWFRNDVLIPGQTTNVLVVSEPGSYRLGIDDTGGRLCPTFSCCPFLVEAAVVPVFQAAAIAATCQGVTPQPNGQLVLSGFSAGLTYQYSLGTGFDSANSLSGAPQGIPANGLIASTLLSTTVAQAYTVRVTNSSGCYTDVTVTLAPTVCECPATICVPFSVRRTKGTR